MLTYVTRARRDWVPGEQSHPGYVEFDDGVSTGRIVFAPVRVLPAVSKLNTGLRRHLETDIRFRDMIDKFDHGGELSDKELRCLLQFYGVMVRMSEIVGLPYYLVTANVDDRRRRLISLAEQRGWSQSLIDMYGLMVERVRYNDLIRRKKSVFRVRHATPIFWQWAYLATGKRIHYSPAIAYFSSIQHDTFNAGRCIG